MYPFIWETREIWKWVLLLNNFGLFWGNEIYIMISFLKRRQKISQILSCLQKIWVFLETFQKGMFETLYSIHKTYIANSLESWLYTFSRKVENGNVWDKFHRNYNFPAFPSQNQACFTFLQSTPSNYSRLYKVFKMSRAYFASLKNSEINTTIKHNIYICTDSSQKCYSNTVFFPSCSCTKNPNIMTSQLNELNIYDINSDMIFSINL